MLIQCLITVTISTFKKLLLEQCSIDDDNSMLKCPTMNPRCLNSSDGVWGGEGGTGGLTRPVRSHRTSVQTVAGIWALASGHRVADKLCPSVCETNW